MLKPNPYPWFWPLLSVASATRAGLVTDGFDAPEVDAVRWRVEARGEVRVVAGTLHLYSAENQPSVLALRELLAGEVYALRFDFRPEAGHQDGYAWTIQHKALDGPTYWYIEFMAGGQRVSAYRTWAGNWTHCGVWDLTDSGKIDPFATWYRVEVRNQSQEVAVRVFVRDTGKEVGAFTVPHDAGPPGEWSFTPNAGTPQVRPDLGGFLDNVLLAGPGLPGEPLPMPSGADRLTAGLRTDRLTAGLRTDRLTAAVEPDGRVFLTRPGAAAPFACAVPRFNGMWYHG
jgi:hypothetical protein